MKILKLWKGGQSSGKISTSRNFLPKKLCLYDAFAHELEHCWHGTEKLLPKDEFQHSTW